MMLRHQGSACAVAACIGLLDTPDESALTRMGRISISSGSEGPVTELEILMLLSTVPAPLPQAAFELVVARVPLRRRSAAQGVDGRGDLAEFCTLLEEDELRDLRDGLAELGARRHPSEWPEAVTGQSIGAGRS